MPAPISIQLYSLREAMKDGNHAAILKKLSDVGYTGVEGAGLYGLAPKEYRKMVNDLGMVVSSNHTSLPTLATLQECIDLHKDLGCEYAICGFWIPDFATPDAIKITADKIAPIIEPLAKAGITFLLHNHWPEFTRVGGILAYDILIKHCPNVKFQVDTYWACNFGAEKPAEMVKRYRDRTPLLHLKDGHFEKDKPQMACGAGKQDFPAIIAAADPKVLKWSIVELDECATDMFQAVEASYHYLVGKGLATGRKPARAQAR